MNSACSNLWANTSYCVKPVGNIETYSGYTTTTAATTFTRPVTATDFVPSPIQTATLQPQASGTISDCYVYENAFDATSKVENLSVANSCSSWAQFASVTVEQLVEWNPSLSASNCVLQAGKSYCVQKWQSPRKIFHHALYLVLCSARSLSADVVAYFLANVALPYDYCEPVNSTRIPASSVQPSGCSCYTNFRIQDKGSTISSAMSLQCLHAD